ncbi:MAG: RluA family pseudouridine synthase [Actinobacteria bacterium]|nr:RluA family pseudouridine synthase [Actinomycetota bacterium]
MVTEQDAGARIDVVLAREAQVTRTRAQRALKSGGVTVDGEEVRASFRLEVGQSVGGTIPPDELDDPQPQDIPIAIRYSDERVLVVSKPPGLVTHPARGHASGTLVNALLSTGEPLAGAGSMRPGIVHRLDKDTSGLLLVAKDDDAQRFLVDALAARRVTRTYLALVRGAPSPSGSVDAPIGRHNVNRTKMAVVAGGRPSVTHYRTVATDQHYALLEVTLETGRTHQIRVHLSHIGHPVLGDRTYGGMSDDARALGLVRPFLHASKLAFPHPDGGRTIEVEDPLPPDLQAALDAADLN